MNAERRRIEENNSRAQRWHLWGPYLSERCWNSTLSRNGDEVITVITHEHCDSKALTYRQFARHPAARGDAAQISHQRRSGRRGTHARNCPATSAPYTAKTFLGGDSQSDG